ncbi:protein ADM2a [Solea solea]|uniref:protein ADM2a n=1 Tax=Solea solea TaxID=90069 RepID=UPI00272AE41E|nr:protein ADM2a [Solea solea]
MRSLLPLTVYCISLVSLQQLKALPAQERPDSNRLGVFTKLINKREEKAMAPGSQSDVATPSPAPSQYPKWLESFLGHPPAAGVRISSPGLAWLKKASQKTGRALRVRRHAHSGLRGGHHPHHPQLMRVGCVLGTCQVQNLSHRLYQLIGQNGRENSSPINPRSPHSYG